MHHYPFNVGAYLLDTVHMDQDEQQMSVPRGLVRDIAYRRLIDLYYDIEGPITNKETDWVCSKIRMLKFKPIVASVLKEFFELRDGFWHNEKCDREIARYKRKADSARLNGQSGGRPRSSDASSKPKKTQSVATRTRTRTTIPPAPNGGDGDTFDSFWEMYPRKVGKPIAEKAFAKAVERADVVTIMAGLAAQLPCEQWKDKTKIPHPTTWLNRDGWADEVIVGNGKQDEAPKEWHETREGVEAKARDIGHREYSETEAFPAWRASVMRAAGAIKSPEIGLEELTGMAARRFG